MRNYIILNNKRSDTISGLIIQELPAISKPAQRTQIETIDGRDGDIVTPLGYAAYDKTFTIGLYGNFDINEIIAYFATKGTAIFSNEPDKYYYYQIVDQIDYERLVRYRVATVTMHVQPFKYSATEGTITVDASDAVSGEGSDIVLDGTAEAPFNTLRHKGNATQQTYAGKNILNINALNRTLPYTLTSRGVTFTVNTDGSVVIDGTNDNTGNSVLYIYNTQTPLALDAGDYTGDINPTDGVYRSVDFNGYNGSIYRGFRQNTTLTLPASDWQFYLQVGKGNTTNFSNYKIYPMLEAGATKSPYEPYVGNLPSPSPDYPQDISLLTGDSTITIDDGGENSQEYVIPFGDTYLAKIGDYADEPVKVDGTWYIRRAIGKKVFDGSEAWAISNTGTDKFFYRVNNAISNIKPTTEGGATSDLLMSNIGTPNGVGNTNTVKGIFIILTSAEVRIRYGTEMPIADWKAFLGDTNMHLYYVLATPTDEAITDQDLIDALDELYDQAHSYKGHTHITATAADGNAPAVLSVDVNEDNESTVTNAGNTTSRPILTIYGQGDIGVYINDVEVLDVALGDEEYITLDSVEMEAYKDTTANLKNRLVTGDYSKLALNAGANKIRFTGKVTKYEISKYSRWL